MRTTTEIVIDIDVHQAIECRRTSFDQTPNDILREILAIPGSKPETLQPLPVSRRRTGRFAFILHGEQVEEQSLKAAYLRCLQMLADLDASFLERLSTERTRARRLVAREPKDLYLNSPRLAEKFAVRLADVWWVDTNLSRQQVEKNLQIACGVADIGFGADLRLLFPD